MKTKTMEILERNDFRNRVLQRDGNKCVFCQRTDNLAVHHIVERKLFNNGGYYISNGASLCPDCHLKAERCEISCQEIRSKAKIKEIVLPDGFDKNQTYDKWGKVMREDGLKKYPRTPHIEFSKIQSGDEDLSVVPFSDLKGKNLVVEEKIDGASTAISSINKNLMLQCRGHYLLGKGDLPQFEQFKTWANTWKNDLVDFLGEDYIMYGEWMSNFHSVYYDLLPHYFMEFDIFDKKNDVFLSTEKRKELLEYLPVRIESVKVLKEGKFETLEEITSLVSTSHFISENAYEDLKKEMEDKRFPEEQMRIILKLNEKRLMEGLYIKWEEDGIVKGRYKYVRNGFVQSIKDGGQHWMDRPQISNRMITGKSMFETKE